jgi:hypothetical protein
MARWLFIPVSKSAFNLGEFYFTVVVGCVRRVNIFNGVVDFLVRWFNTGFRVSARKSKIEIQKIYILNF